MDFCKDADKKITSEVCSYCDIIALSLCEETLPSVWGDGRKYFHLKTVKKQVYCVCVHVSVVTASSNHKLSTGRTSEEEMYTKTSKHFYNEINSEMVEMVWHVNEEDIWSLSVEETKDQETQMFHLENKKSTTRDGLDDYANTKENKNNNYHAF